MKRSFFTAALAIALAAVLFTQSALAAEPLLAVSEAYRDSEFCTRLRAVELSGDYRADLVNVALSQLGYHEGNSREDYGGGSVLGSDNYIEYASAFYGWDGEWCAMFVSWCARQAGVPKYVINNAARAASDGVGGSRKYYFHVSTRKPSSGYVPVPGDLVFFTYDGYSSAHVGIVCAVTDEGIWTVEGNSNNAVRMNFYDWASPAILRYGVYSYSEPFGEIARVETTELRFASYAGEEHGAAPDGKGGYLFERLYAAAGRPFQLPDRAFCREGLTLLGYYVRRADGLWLTEALDWAEAETLRTGKAEPYLVSDSSGWVWDGPWAGEETLELHCVWTDGQGSIVPDATAAALRRPDESGWQNPYPDLWESQWYYADVRGAAQAGLLPYVGTLEAGRAASRGDLAQMLYRLSGSPKPKNDQPFADVPAEGELADAVAWAYSAELFRGLSETEFAPEAALPREQAVTVLWRLRGSPAETAETAEPAFDDGETVSDWAAEAVRWAAAEGLVKGETGDGEGLLLWPGRALSRAEAIALLRRVEKMQK